MKRVILCFALVLACSCAFADIHEFKYFYIDIPEGWSVSSRDSMININADDDSGSLMIKADSLNNNLLSKVAGDFAKEFGASVVNVDSEDNYTFEFNNGSSQAIITGSQDDGFYMFIAGTGFEVSGDALMKILDSLEMK